MKDGPVIESGLRQREKVLDMLGSFFGEEHDFHLAEFRLDHGLRRFRRRLIRGERGACSEIPGPAQNEADRDDHCHCPSLHDSLLQ